MNWTRKIIATLAGLFFFSTSQAGNLFPQDTIPQQDSIGPEECTGRFFQRSEKLPVPAKTFLLTKAGKTLTVPAFLKAGDTGGFAESGLTDLDHDGKKELVISTFTGGAHCCDVLYIFKNTAPNKYQFAAKTFAGNVCITDDNEFLYDFYEQFGYFFTCFACAYEDSTETAPIPLHNIVLRYNKGKLTVVPGDKDLRSQVNDNLAKLGEQPYEKLEDEAAQDNGLRKELALNLAVFYYSFGHNLAETKKLFDKYYKYPDSRKVWAEFVRILQHMKKDNNF